MTLLDSLQDIIDLQPFVGTSAVSGVRYNPRKLTAERFEELFPLPLTPAAYFDGGYRVDGDTAGLGNHPLHLGGGCYFQEPSAMSAVTALGVQNGDRVLDLCAAPGSKATALAAQNPDGITVTNEIHPKRAAVLLSNIERMGIASALVTQSDAASLRAAFGSWFDKILVDAPCSGEGMFRKYPELLTDWTEELVAMCAERSREILEHAAAMLRPGGRLVYSTCTFNEAENERNILDFLAVHPEFTVAEHGIPGVSPGRLGLDGAARIFPSQNGEGHFVCALQKSSEAPSEYVKVECFTPDKLPHEIYEMTSACIDTAKLYPTRDTTFKLIDRNVYCMPADMPYPKGIHILRAGVQAGMCKGKTWVPCHHLFTAAPMEALHRVVTVNDTDADKFLHGELVECGGAGFTAVVWNGLCLGFGKAVDGKLKNHYPKGLRLK